MAPPPSTRLISYLPRDSTCDIQESASHPPAPDHNAFYHLDETVLPPGCSPPSPITAKGAQKYGWAISAGNWPLAALFSRVSCASRSAPETPSAGFSFMPLTVSTTSKAAV